MIQYSLTHISTPERLKYYRDLLGISQDRVTMGRVSRNLISEIERGNRKLTLSTAIILADNLNSIATGNGIDLNINTAELLMSDYEYGELVCSRLYESLITEEFNIKSYIEILEVAKQYSIYNMIVTILHRVGEEYYKQRKYDLALDYLQEALTVANNAKNKELECLIKYRIGTIFYILGEYDTSLNYLKDAYDFYLLVDVNNNILYHRLLYNISLCQNQLSNFDEALRMIQTSLNDDNLKDTNPNEIIDAKLLLGNIYLKQNKIEKALDVYEKLLDIIPEDYRLLHNISLIYTRLNNHSKSLEYLERSIKLQLKQVNKNTSSTLYQLGNLYKERKEYRQAIICIENALKNTKTFKQYNEHIQCYEFLFSVYQDMGKIFEFKPYWESIFSDLAGYPQDANYKLRITFLILQYVSSTGDTDFGKYSINLLTKGGLINESAY